MRKILIIIFFLPIAIFSQTHKVIEVPTYTNVFKSDNGYMLSGIIVEGDTLPYVKLYKIVIF